MYISAIGNEDVEVNYPSFVKIFKKYWLICWRI